MLCINILSLRVCLIFLVLLNLCGAHPRTAPPLKPNFPFAFTWNAPSELCETKFGINLDLSYAQLVSSTLKTATNQSITIFYTDRFGIFPYLDEETGEAHNEGLPQLIDFEEHSELAEEDIMLYIPDDQPGLAVLDFEEWRPQWVRNWGSKEIYKTESIDTIMQKKLFISRDEAEGIAKKQFEAAAKEYFTQSIDLGKTLRPKRLWGYYLYPDCYNYDYNKDMVGYTGKCPEIEINRNDELLWLWESSTALYPSIYLELKLKDSRQATLFVRHRIQESMRVSMLPNKNYAIPIYAYIRIVYKDHGDVYLSKEDLVSTIGEAAALGAAGVVSWGDMNVTESKGTCSAARRYLEKTLNPYLLNVTTAAKFCSKALCSDNGHCVRKTWDSDDYLHLDPSRYRIKWSKDGKLFMKGDLSQDDIDWFEGRFDCLCYSDDPCYSPLTLKKVSNFA